MTDRKIAPDLNALLAQEQTAIMAAEAASDDGTRDQQREIARHAREQVDLTPFPRREAHDFTGLSPAEALQSDEPGPFAAEFQALEHHVEVMDRELGLRLSEGTIGTRHNNYAHRSRLIRQARSRLDALRVPSPGTLRLYPNRIDPLVGSREGDPPDRKSAELAPLVKGTLGIAAPRRDSCA